MLRTFLILAVSAVQLPAATVPPDHAARMAKGVELFNKSLRGLLVENCLKCHGGEKTKAEFDLATRDGLIKGGVEGLGVVPFDAAKSGLLKLVRHEEEPHMPEKKPKLSDAAIAEIAQWIDLGAPYDKPLIEGKAPPRDKSVVTAEDKNWWAFRPLAKVTPPAGAPNPVDAFLSAKAEAKGVKLAPPADGRTVIRRMTLDLTGLPPKPEEVREFAEAYSANPDAAVRALANRLLASPAYGERWARHWLDLARFAESSGFEHDYDRPGAFHYRDFVIRALNDDMPFDQFAHWQIAGDEFAPNDPWAIAATGFLGAGVFPTQITANEVERTRYDALDDMLSTTGSAFLGLTVGCARCHDHKYDPIPTRDYYRMLSTFTTTTRAVVDLEMDPAAANEAAKTWKTQEAALVADRAATESGLKPAFEKWLAAPDLPAAAWSTLQFSGMTSQAGTTFKSLGDGSYLAEGANGESDVYEFTAPASGKVTALKLEALAHASMVKGGPGRAPNGNFALSKIQVLAQEPGKEPREVKIAATQADFEQNKASLSIASSLDDDPKSGWAVDPQFGKDHAAMFTFAGPLNIAPGSSLRVRMEFRVNGRHNIGRPRISVTSSDAPVLGSEALPAVVTKFLESRKLTAEADRMALFDWWKRRDSGWRERDAKIAAHAKKKPSTATKVFACVEGYTPHRMHTQGADFFPETYVLKRGSTELKDGVAAQGFLQVLADGGEAKPWAWMPPAGAKFSGRRRTLANWLTDVDRGAGALAARVIVNRLWQHHFGTGLVATPNDFGRTGTQPSHPELLDWLAGELIRGGWKLKPIHALMITSAAYRQSSAGVHAENARTLFAGRIPSRLEGEAIRDSILSVSGVLDPRMYGEGTRDERSKRRSIYFTVKRSQLVGSMVAFDLPEPLVSQGNRPTTTVAPQALLLMNGPQVREWADAFAKRFTGAGPDPAVQIRHAYMLALQREPDGAELADAVAFMKGGGSPVDFAQVIFALSEFAYMP